MTQDAGHIRTEPKAQHAAVAPVNASLIEEMEKKKKTCDSVV
jgi:hypothetical protein